MSFQGHIEKGMVVLDHLLPLPDGTQVLVEPLTLSQSGFWQSCSLDELAKHQGVTTPETFESLLGGWPTDERNDGFEEVLHGWRAGEQDQRP